MNGQAWLTGASHLPAPLFVLIVGALAIFSVSGVPVPITVTMLFAGAMTTRLPNGGLLFVALVLVLTAALTLRDGITLVLGRHGGRLFARRPTRRALSTMQHEAVMVRSAHIALPVARVQRQAR